jgi:hypothetical protein
METNNQGINQLVEKMALFTDAMDEMFPKGKKIVLVELPIQEFTLTKLQFGNSDLDTKKFTVNISGLEFVFIQDGLLNAEPDSF